MYKVWLFSKAIDLLVLYIPVWLVWGVSFVIAPEVTATEVPTWVWVIFVLGIDVTHVWSSLFRTYLSQEALSENKKLYRNIPLLCFVALLTVNYFLGSYFWTVMAYLAVYHFVKQQIGFLAYYKSRNQDYRDSQTFMSDKRVLYFSMLYPILYWHLQADLNFAWFVENDFISLSSFIDLTALWPFLNSFYWGVMVFWLFKEVWRYKRNSEKSFPWGKTLWVLTTAANWYLGIVYFNSDLIFTLTNVVAHGVPYLGLIIMYELRNTEKGEVHTVSKPKRVITKVLISVALLAFVEEYLWDMLINREKYLFFEQVLQFPIAPVASEWALLFFTALLSLPQVTHYILDAYIWRPNQRNPAIKSLIINYPHA